MSGTKAALFIRIDDRDSLNDIFGAEALDKALADFGNQIDDAIARLLSQHDMIDRCRSVEAGRWMASFRILSGGMPRDTQEACETIEVAAHVLVYDAIADVFGSSTGRRITSTVAVLTLPEDHSCRIHDVSMPWLQTQLVDIPQGRLFEPAVTEAEFDDAIRENRIRTVLQPIVTMADQRTVGYEALTRGPVSSPLERPDNLFQAAHAFHRSVELELLCARLALERTASKVPGGQFLTVNLGPEALLMAESELPLKGREDVIFELTEHMPIDAAERLAGVVDRLRARGIGLALDDTGCGFADLDTTKILRPEIVKLCITIVRNSDKGSPYLTPIQKTTRTLQELGSKVLAEGVETQGQHISLSGCAIEYAQGWFYGKPDTIDAAFSQS